MLFPVGVLHLHNPVTIIAFCLKCVGFSRLSTFVRYARHMRSNRRKQAKKYFKKLIRDQNVRSLLNVYSLQIIFVALTELGRGHGFGFAHIVD